MAYINTGAYDKWLRERQQQELTNRYNAEKAALDQKYENGGLGGFLGSIVGGIGKGIGDIGYSLGGLFGTAGASLKDIVEGKAGTAENTNAFKRSYYGAKDDKDAAAKAAGNALNAATNLATVVAPGVAGAGTAAGKVLGGAIANTAAGAIGGVADEFAQQGSDARLDSAANRALSGAAAGAVTGKLGNKIGNAKSALGKTLLNNKIATSTIGRGALSGALGGATGAGTSAALSGGDVLGEAIEGAKSGAISGGVQAGVMSAAKTAGKGLLNTVDNLYSKAQNRNAVNRLASGIEYGADGNIKFARISKQTLADINNLRSAQGLEPITKRQVTAYKNAINNNLNNRVSESSLTPRTVAEIAFDSLMSPKAIALPGNFENTVMVSPYDNKKYNGSVIGIADDGGTSLKSIENRKTSFVNRKSQEKSDLLSRSGSPLAANQEGGVTQTGTSLGNAEPLGTLGNSISQDKQNVNPSVSNGYGQEDYMMGHRPNKNGNFAYDLTNSAKVTDIDTAAPNDVYDNPQYYIFSGSDKSKAETAAAVKALKDASPEKRTKIYRATPGDTINPGDWVTLSKEYANDHKNSWLEGKGDVIEMEVPARDIRWAGDDLQEWGYFPQQKKIYHGTTATFEDFNEDNPSTWFSSSNKNLKDTGLRYDGTGELNVMERELPAGIKLADEDMADNLTKQQLIDRGYEGVYYTERGPNGDETYYEIFKPNTSLRKVQPEAPVAPTARSETQPVVETPISYEEPVVRDYTTPTDYQGNELKIRNRNLLEKAGGILSNAGEAIKNSDVYNSLYSKTANRVTRNDSINKLRQLGFEPSDYAEAAKISTTTNKFVDDIVKNSGAKVTDATFAQKILSPDDNIIISDPTYKKKYDTKVRQLLDRIETGDYPGQYNASDLLKESRNFGNWANDLRKKSVNVNGDVINRDGYELADAYTDVKYALRDLASQAVDGFGDNYTKSQLSERLKKLGAPQEAIDYMLDAEDIGGFIRNTSLFEDARQMAREMEETKIRRNAIAGSSTSPTTIALNAAGIPQLLKAGLTPIGRVTGGLAKGIGDAAQSIGSRLPEGGQASLTPDQQLILGNFIGRSEGQRQANNLNTEAQKARDYQSLEELLSQVQALEGPVQPAQPSANAIKLQSQLKQTTDMMNQALAMSDLTTYGKLQSVYNQLYNAYKNEMPDTSNNMTMTQKNKLVKLQNANDALDQLQQLYENAGGAQGFGGNVSNWLGGIGLNDNLNNYNKSVKTLINQISSAVGSTVSADLIPRSTDSEAEAQNKIQTLRRLIDQASGNYNLLYAE